MALRTRSAPSTIRRRRQAPAQDRPAVPRPEGRRERQAPTQDHALYSCSCGLQFEASVSTTVACPHCGSQQAW